MWATLAHAGGGAHRTFQGFGFFLSRTLQWEFLLDRYSNWVPRSEPFPPYLCDQGPKLEGKAADLNLVTSHCLLGSPLQVSSSCYVQGGWPLALEQHYHRPGVKWPPQGCESLVVGQTGKRVS